MGYRETSPEAAEKVEKIELLQRESWRRVGRRWECNLIVINRERERER